MPQDKPLARSEACFGESEDPRAQGRCQYSLVASITIAIGAVIAGADLWLSRTAVTMKAGLTYTRLSASDVSAAFQVRSCEANPSCHPNPLGR
jgi:hypothetical protein